jgi:hypothetical protein
MPNLRYGLSVEMEYVLIFKLMESFGKRFASIDQLALPEKLGVSEM